MAGKIFTCLVCWAMGAVKVSEVGIIQMEFNLSFSDTAVYKQWGFSMFVIVANVQVHIVILAYTNNHTLECNSYTGESEHPVTPDGLPWETTPPLGLCDTLTIWLHPHSLSLRSCLAGPPTRL